MFNSKKRILSVLAIAVVLMLSVFSFVCFAEGEAAADTTPFAGTFWALLPPVIAIGLALITKEVYSSLFIGVLVGGLLAANFVPLATVDNILNEGLIAAVSGTAGIFIFLVVIVHT